VTFTVLLVSYTEATLDLLRAGVPNPAPADPTQFISNSNQTHLKQPIKVFRVTWKLKS